MTNTPKPSTSAPEDAQHSEIGAAHIPMIMESGICFIKPLKKGTVTILPFEEEEKAMIMAEKNRRDTEIKAAFGISEWSGVFK